MRICRVCEGNCYDDELVGGVCHECREAEKRRDREGRLAKMLNSPARQISLFDGNGQAAYRGRFNWN